MKKETILRWIIYVGAGLLTLIPLITASSMYFPFITGKAFFFRVIVMLMFGAWSILALYDHRVRPKWSPVAWALAALGGVALIASLLGVNPSDSIWSNFERMMGWITLLHLGLLFITLAHTFRPKHWNYLFYLSLGISVIVAFIGYGQIPDTSRIDSTLGNPIYLAMYTVFHAMLAGFFILYRFRIRLQESKKIWTDWQPYLFGLVGILNLLALYFTRGRGAMLGLLVGLGVALILVAIFERRHVWVRYVATGAVILTVLVGGIFLANRNTDFVQNNDVLSSFANISLNEGTAGARMDIWSVAFEGYAHSPKTILIGWGPGNFNYVFNTYYNPELFDQETWFDRAHNVAIEWLVAAGPLGFLSYLALFVTAIYLIWKRDERRDDEWMELSVLEKSMLTGLVLAYLVQNLFVFDHLVSYWLLAMLLAWIHGRSIHHESLGILTMIKGWFTKDAEWLSSEEAKAWVGTGIGVATLLAVVLINYPGYAQTTTLINALTETENQPGMALETYQAAIDYDAMGTQEARERLINTTQNIVSDNGVDSEIAQQYFTVAQDEIRVQIAEESEDLRHQVFLGQLMMVYGQYDEAVEAFATADEMGNGRKQANILRLAQAQFAAGNPEAAAESYARAYELDTSFDEPAIRYATGLIQIDEQEQADAVLENHFGTTTVNSEYLIKVYLDEEKYEKLIPILELRLQNNQTDIQPYINLASALVRTGRQADAQEVIDRAGQIFPQIEGQEDEVLQQLEDTNPLGS